LVPGWLWHFLRDVRFGWRDLAANRAFAAVAAASLALGIGGSTAMYSVIHAVVIDPFPYREPERLMSVSVLGSRGGNGSYYTIDDFLGIAQRNTVFSGVIASTWSDVTWTGAGDPQRLRGNHCTMNTFEVMGVAPLIGRVPAPPDASAGAESVTVLGFKFWQRAFGGDPGVLGRKLRLNGKMRTVIGVMPQRFMWRGADVYLPDVFHSGATLEGVREVHLLGRLKPGVTRGQATAQLSPLFDELQRLHPDDFPKSWRLELRDLAETFPSDIRDSLWILFGAVGLLLVIACVNVSNLLLSRALARRREIAIRVSLGAQRWRVVRQLLAESLVLALAGAAIGVVLAYAGIRGIVAVVPPNTIPDEAKIEINGMVLLFTLGVSVFSALLFGIAPALHASGLDILAVLKEAGRGAAGGRGQRLLRGALVAGEVALSLMLLVGASLMIRTLKSIEGVRLGFRPDRIWTLRVPLSDERYPDLPRRNAFFEDVLQRIRTVPGVAAVGINTGLPPVYSWAAPVVAVASTRQDQHPVLFHQVTEDYWKVMGIGLVGGRLFTAQEVNRAARTVVVNRSFARRYYGDGQAIGKVVRIPRLRLPPFRLADDSFQIAGVVQDTVNQLATVEIWPEMFVPYTLTGMADRIFVLAAGRPEAIAPAIRAQVFAVDPGQPVMEEKPLEALLIENAYAQPRFNLLLFAIFAALGLALALSGIYGVVSHAVAQQTREIGIRVALGAGPSRVIAAVMGMSARLLAIGVALGLAGSLASVRLLKSLVHNVSPLDPYSFVAMTALLVAAGLFAAFWPALRVTRVDPVKALRQE
jgi:predicted permease